MFQDQPTEPKVCAIATQHRPYLDRKTATHKGSKIYLGFTEAIAILKVDRHPRSYSWLHLRSSYNKRSSVSRAICVFSQSLILLFIYSIHISPSPHLKISPLKQRKKQTVAVRAAPRRREDCMQWGAAWFRKGCTKLHNLIFKILRLIGVILT
jgi:hypothetical protein